MLNYVLSVVLLLASATMSFAQDSITARLAKIEENNAGITSMLAAQRGRIDNLQRSVDALSAKVDALGGAKLAAKSDWAGDQSFTQSAWAPATASWSSSPAMFSSGDCAKGQCGVGARLLGHGIFHRR